MMKKIVTLSILLLLLFTKIIAQNNLPPAYEIKSDTIFHDSLPDNYWQM